MDELYLSFATKIKDKSFKIIKQIIDSPKFNHMFSLIDTKKDADLIYNKLNYKAILHIIKTKKLTYFDISLLDRISSLLCKSSSKNIKSFFSKYSHDEIIAIMNYKIIYSSGIRYATIIYNNILIHCTFFIDCIMYNPCLANYIQNYLDDYNIC